MSGLERFSVKWKRYFGVLAILVLFVASLACNLSQTFSNPPTVVPSPLATNTLANTSTSTLTPTTTPSPTVYRTPTKTIKPTKRPTWTPYPSRTLRPTWTASPTLSPTVTPNVIPVLKEDFSDPMTPWLKTKGKNYAMGIAGKKYFMTIKHTNLEITSSRTWLKLAEVRIEADITFNNGVGYYGFSCRESSSNYYTLFISSDGHYGLGQTINGRVKFLVYRKAEKVIKTGKGAKNHVRGDCRGNTLTLYVNNKALARKKISGLGPGYVGMMAGTGNTEDNLTVYFDNLVIWGP